MRLPFVVVVVVVVVAVAVAGPAIRTHLVVWQKWEAWVLYSESAVVTGRVPWEEPAKGRWKELAPGFQGSRR